MKYFIIALAAVAVLALAITAVIFFKIFYSSRKKPKHPAEYPLPPGKVYEPHYPQMMRWMDEMRAMNHTDVSVTSYDGLRLCGKYYEYKKGAPIEILFHGYRGTAERDLCGGVARCFEIGHNALIVDQRAAGASEGRVITFGAKESRDCLTWLDFVINNVDREAKIILTGISMGAATVMTAAFRELPGNVIGILADCGYTSTRAIVKKVMSDMKLPADLLYPFARLGAMLFGGFDPDRESPLESMKLCRLPVIFFHGDTDDYVPCDMSRENFAACASENKKLVIIHGAGHGLCFPVDTDRYLRELDDFFAPFV